MLIRGDLLCPDHPLEMEAKLVSKVVFLKIATSLCYMTHFTTWKEAVDIEYIKSVEVG